MYLTFSLLGYIILRQIVGRIIKISADAASIHYDTLDVKEQNELKKIAATFNHLVTRLEENTTLLGKRVHELASLRELTESSSKIINITDLFGIALEKLMITTDSSYGTIMSLSGDRTKLKVEAVRGVHEFTNINTEIDISSTISGRVIKENITLVCEDPSLEDGFNISNDSVFEGGPFIAKAITARGKSIGVLNLSRGKNGKQFIDSEVDYISIALGQISFAFDNAQLIRDMKDAYTELKAAQQKLVTYERMSAINQTVVTLSDKINNPLMVIGGHIELLSKNLGTEDPMINRSFELIKESLDTCNEIMTKLREIHEHEVTDYPGGEIKMIDIEPPKKDGEESNSQENENRE